jgi:hypothetical protein
MSDILKSEILPVAKTDKKTSTSKVANEPKEEGGSLFDNILKQTKSTKQAEQTTQTSKETKKVETDEKNPIEKTSKNIQNDAIATRTVEETLLCPNTGINATNAKILASNNKNAKIVFWSSSSTKDSI